MLILHAEVSLLLTKFCETACSKSLASKRNGVVGLNPCGGVGRNTTFRILILSEVRDKEGKWKIHAMNPPI